MSGLNSQVTTIDGALDSHMPTRTSITKADVGQWHHGDPPTQLVSVRLQPSTSGLSVSGGDLSVTVKEGVEIDANALRVDEAYRL